LSQTTEVGPGLWSPRLYSDHDLGRALGGFVFEWFNVLDWLTCVPDEFHGDVAITEKIEDGDQGSTNDLESILCTVIYYQAIETTQIILDS
jgi:hypothetical protein